MGHPRLWLGIDETIVAYFDIYGNTLHVACHTVNDFYLYWEKKSLEIGTFITN